MRSPAGRQMGRLLSAYDNRGRAYASKGDYTRAIADEVRASQLIAKATIQPTVIAPTAPKTTKVSLGNS